MSPVAKLMPLLWQRLPYLPALAEFWATEAGSLWSPQRVLARVEHRHVQARDTVTLLLRPNARFSGFRAGQHVLLTVPVNGRRLTRSYSFSDAPRSDGLLELTIRRSTGGVVSTYVCQQLQVGDVLELGEVFGDLHVSASPTVLLAAGSGITPLMALLRQALASGRQAPLTLLYWAAERADLCFVAELQALQQQHAQFRVHFLLTRSPQAVAGAEQGRISAEQLARLLPDLQGQAVRACGPAGFVASARQLLQTRCPDFQAEAFTPPQALAVDGVQSVGSVRVELAKSGRVLELPTDRPLLAALEAQGINPPSGCRMGICHTCSCQKRAGSTQDLLSGEVQTEPGALRLCINAARADLILDL